LKALEKTRSVEVNGDFDSHKFEVSITPQFFHHLSSTIYNDKVSAVIREYHNNAWDSHVMAGNTDPVFVQLPTSLDPRLVIRDFGTGLSEAGCRIFTTYFKSTKTDTNEQNGFLGLGCKSFFAMSESFNIKSYYNGTLYSFSAYKDEEGYPVLAKLMEVETDEPNGIEISGTVPKDLIWKFEDKAYNVFKFMDVPPKTNLSSLNEKIALFKKNSTQHGDIILNKKDREYGLRVVMSNVAYRYTNIPESIKKLCYGHLVYVNIPNGSGEFNLGREDLVVSDKINQLIENAVEVAIPGIIKDLQDSIDECEYEHDARILMCSSDMASLFPGKVKFKGKVIQRKVALPDDGFVDYYYYGNTSGTCRKYKRPEKESWYGKDSVDLDYTTSVFSIPKDKELENIKHSIRRSNHNNALIVTPEQAEKLGINPDTIIDPSTLPEKPVSSRSYNSTPTIKCYKISNGMATEFSGRLPAGSVYTTIFRKTINTMCPDVKYGYGISTLNRVIKDISEHIEDMEDIYVIRTSISKTQWFSKLNCKNMDDYLKEELKDVKTVRITGYGYREWRKLANILPKDPDLKLLNGLECKYAAYYSEDGNVTQVDFDKTKIKLRKRYPLLKIINLDSAFNNKENTELLKKVLK
jgi:hypothetical protein